MLRLKEPFDPRVGEDFEVMMDPRWRAGSLQVTVDIAGGLSATLAAASEIKVFTAEGQWYLPPQAARTEMLVGVATAPDEPGQYTLRLIARYAAIGTVSTSKSSASASAARSLKGIVAEVPVELTVTVRPAGADAPERASDSALDARMRAAVRAELLERVPSTNGQELAKIRFGFTDLPAGFSHRVWIRQVRDGETITKQTVMTLVTDGAAGEYRMFVPLHVPGQPFDLILRPEPELADRERDRIKRIWTGELVFEDLGQE